LRITDFLLQKKCKVILIACNTASAAAYDAVKNHVGNQIPVLNVIDPVVDAVTSNQKIKKVGIIGTKATIRSGIYEQKLKAKRSELETVSQATALLASMIEAGFYNNSVSQAVINSYLAYPDFSDIDSIVLACTHYPLIKKEVASFFNNRLLIFDSNEPAANAVYNVLQKNDLLNKGGHAPHEFYVSDFTESFQQTTRIFFEDAIHLEENNLWNNAG
jgi:glutamate racemase